MNYLEGEREEEPADEAEEESREVEGGEMDCDGGVTAGGEEETTGREDFTAFLRQQEVKLLI